MANCCSTDIMIYSPDKDKLEKKRFSMNSRKSFLTRMRAYDSVSGSMQKQPHGTKNQINS